MTLSASSHLAIPPGFRFHPTDEELVNYYLRKKVALEKFELDVIRDVDLNKLEPWDLDERCKIDSTPQTEWYLFSHKDKKYPTGTRTNRATAAGFWKATGRDKAVHSHFKRIGMRKTLVFYTGRAPHGQKTDWIMHEYRLEETQSVATGNEDGWVVCRVFKKRSHHHKGSEHHLYGSEDNSLLQKIESCSDVYGEATPNESIICKQEFEYDDFDLHNLDPFLQLPPLERPKMNCGTQHCNLFCDTKRVVTDNFFRRQAYPSFFPLDAPATERTKSAFAVDNHLEESVESANSMEWGILKSISKEFRCDSEINKFSGDVQYPPQRQVQFLDFPSNCDSDPWNFP